MANNRMFLVYRPTGTAVFLGKRLASGWHGVPDNLSERIMALFEHTEQERGPDSSQDDFAIALEVGDNQPHVISTWIYVGPVDESGLEVLYIDESVPRGTGEFM